MSYNILTMFAIILYYMKLLKHVSNRIFIETYVNSNICGLQHLVVPTSVNSEIC